MMGRRVIIKTKKILKIPFGNILFNNSIKNIKKRNLKENNCHDYIILQLETVRFKKNPNSSCGALFYELLVSRPKKSPHAGVCLSTLFTTYFVDTVYLNCKL